MIPLTIIITTIKRNKNINKKSTNKYCHKLINLVMDGEEGSNVQVPLYQAVGPEHEYGLRKAHLVCL